ncbi:hypothetical protein ACFXKI_30880 [Streptomyces mirabilis]|uniref:hypothetical protein n=1 Tax=Streptomyces mirabilis TaxID=68239 RepID=UPI0036C9C93E
MHDDPSRIASLLRARYKQRLPSSLNEQAGPEHGMVELPLHIAWSGLRILDLDRAPPTHEPVENRARRRHA